MARTALTVVGTVVGAYFGYPQLGFALGSLAGGLVENANLPDNEGPRLDDLSVNSNTEGSDMTRAWGNIRLQAKPVFAPPLEEHRTKESASSKGGPSNITSSYTATQLLSVGQVPPGTKLRRVYANKTLVYDASANADAVSAGYRITWYDGSQTEPDPIYESYVGAGNATAYKGHGILLMDNWDVSTEFSGQPPLIEVAVCTNGTNTLVTNSVKLGPAVNNLGSQTTSKATGRLYMSLTKNVADGAYLVEVDPWTQVVTETRSLGLSNETQVLAVGKAGSTGTGEWLVSNARGGDELTIYDLTNDWAVLGMVAGSYYGLLADNDGWILVRTSAALRLLKKEVFSSIDVTPPSGYGLGYSAVCLADGRFLVPLSDGISASVGLLTVDVAGTWSWSVITTTGYDILGSVRAAIVDDAGVVWLSAGSDRLVAIDQAGVVLLEYTLSDLGFPASWGSGSGDPLLYYDSTTQSIYLHAVGIVGQFHTATHQLHQFPDGTPGSWSYYHPETDTCWTGHQAVGGYAVAYAVRLHVVEPVPFPVSEIVTDICTDAGLDIANDLNLTALPPTLTVGGFVHTRQTSARADLEALLRAVQVEAVISDWQLKLVPLGGPVVTTIDVADLGARQDTEQAGPPIEVIEPESIALPGEFQLRHISSDRELQPAMQRSQFGAAGSGKTVTLDVTVTMSDAEAATLCQILHQLACEQVGLKFNLPRRYAQLEPTDPFLVPLPGGETVRARFTKIDRGANGVHVCEAVTDLVSHLTADAVAGGSGLTAASILSSSPAELIVLDGPLLRDSDADHPGPYLTAFTYGAGFTGVSLNVSADGQVYTAFSSLTDEPVLGTCETVPLAVDFEDWDDTNTLRITVRTSGSFSGVTDAALLAGANAAAWGRQGRWEFIHFGEQTQIDATTWDLTHLLRGRRGTEWAMGLHQPGDWFILLTDSTVARHVLSVSDIGATRQYRAPRFNEALSDVRAKAWTVGNAPLVPYSPVGLTATFTDNDASLDWTRRTRGGGAYGGVNGLTDGVGGALREDSEAWLVTIRDGAGAVLNTYTHNGPPPLAYSEAAITADHGGTYPLEFHWDVAQISGVVGPGHAAATVTTTTPIGSAYVQAVISDGATHLWRLSDSNTTALDLVGSLDGTFAGSVTHGEPSLLSDGSGASTQFTGGYMSVATDADLQAIRTVELLLAPDAFAATAVTAAIVTCHSSAGSYSGFTLTLQDDGGLHVGITNATTAVLGLDVEGLTALSTPVHLALQWDGFTTADQIRLVVDGTVAASGYPSADWAIGANPLRVGKSNDSYWEALSGHVQESAIYDTPVPVSTLLNHAQLAGTAPPP